MSDDLIRVGSDCYLLIPVEGLMEVWHIWGKEGERINMPDTKTMLQKHGEGAHMTLNLRSDGEHLTCMEMLYSDTGPVNPRARAALEALTGIHMVITGPVMFRGISEEKCTEITAALS